MKVSWLWRGVGVNYEGGVLDAPARAAIQIAHRIGAAVVFCYLGWLAYRLASVRGLAAQDRARDRRAAARAGFRSASAT